MLAEFYLYNGNKLRIYSNGEIFLIEKNKSKEIKRLVQCDVLDFFPYVEKVRINDGLQQNNFELFNLIRENFDGYETRHNIPVASMEKNPIDLKNGYLFMGETSSDQIFGFGKNILDIFDPGGCDANVDTDYMKFRSKNGEILFVAKKPVKHSVSWNSINGGSDIQDPGNENSAVYGAMQEGINGETYKIRLLTGGNSNQASGAGGEWGDLLVALNIYDSNSYNDAYFRTGSGNGGTSWTQEQYGSSSSYRVTRGYLGVSGFHYFNSSNTHSFYGWRPALELVP
jgi:hypothetical protein